MNFTIVIATSQNRIDWLINRSLISVYKQLGINKSEWCVLVIDDNENKHNLKIHGIEVLGDRYEIPEIIEEYGIKEVIIAIPSAEGNEIKEIFNLSNKKGAYHDNYNRHP